MSNSFDIFKISYTSKYVKSFLHFDSVDAVTVATRSSHTLVFSPQTWYHKGPKSAGRSILMTDYFHLDMGRDQLLALSSLGLAHLGDSVFEVMVRSWALPPWKGQGKGPPPGDRNLCGRARSGPAAGANPAPAYPGGGGCLSAWTKYRAPLGPQGGQPGRIPGCHRTGGPVWMAVSPREDRAAQSAV